MLDPVSDPAVPLDDKPAAFASWVSSYFTPVACISDITRETLRKRAEEGTPTVQTLSPEDLARIVEGDVIFRSGGLMLQTRPEIHERHTRCTFLDADLVLPDVEVVALWCDRSPWVTVWAAKVLEELLHQERDRGKRRMPTSLVKLENANHFVSCAC